MESLPPIVKIDSGADFTLCLDGEGRVFSFGKNSYGQLGLTGANTYKMNTPQQVQLPHGTSVVDIACGEEHAALLTAQGQVFTWGFGNDG